MSKIDTVRAAMMQAMKDKNKERKESLSMLLSALKNKAIDKRADLTEEEENAVVLGVSKDSVASHRKFADKYKLPFRLLSDPDTAVLQAYGVWQEKKLYGKVSMGVVRTTYVIDGQGIVEKVMPRVKPDTNADQLLAYLRESRR